MTDAPTPPPRRKAAKAKAAEYPVLAACDHCPCERVVAKGLNWDDGVCRARTARARRIAVRVYRKNPTATPAEVEDIVKNRLATTGPDGDDELAGLDMQTIMLIVTVVLKFLELWRSRKATVVAIMRKNADEGEPQIVSEAVYAAEIEAGDHD